MARVQVLSTRLFPKNRGARSYSLTGLAARCDWVVVSDMTGNGPDVALLRNSAGPPRTVFLSLREPFSAVAYFYRHVLPDIQGRFVLISGSEDVTLPNQVDCRWRKFNAKEHAIIKSLLEHPQLLHWYMENRDEILPGTSSMPVGLVFEEGDEDVIEIPSALSPLRNRPLRAFCAHRIRSGPQWEVRRIVSSLCSGPFAGFVDLVKEEVPFNQYKELLARYPFVICAKGGGLDPSPKAWLALAQGSIPIIRSSALDDAYVNLPVVFVDDWNDDCLSLRKLALWRDRLAPFFDDPVLRAAVVEKLSLDFWWQKIQAHLG